MKLPGTRRIGVQSLGRESIHLPAQVQHAENRAITDTYSGLSQISNQFAAEYIRRQNELEMDNGDELMGTEQTDTVTSFKDKQYYTLNEIPEGIGIRRTQKSFDEDYNEIVVPRNRVPGYEVKAGIYKHRMLARAKQIANGFTDQRVGSKWLHGQTQMIEENHRNLTVEMLEEQRHTIQKGREEAYENFVTEQNYELARNVIAAMEIDDAKKAQYTRNLEQRIETDTYDGVLADLEDPYARNALETGLAFVTAEDEHYYSSMGTLDAAKRRTYASAFRSALKMLDNLDNERSKKDLELLRMRLAEMNKQILNGDVVNPQLVAELNNLASVHPELTSERYKMQFAHVAREAAASTASNPAAGKVLAEEARVIAHQQGQYDALHTARIWSDMADTQVQEKADDSVTYNEKWMGLFPTHLNKENMADIGPYRSQLVQMGSTQHYLKKPERRDIIYSLNEGGIKQRMMTAKQVVKAFGEGSPEVMQELGQAGLSGPILVIGTLLADDQVLEAEYVMRGQELAEADKGGKFMKDQQDRVDRFITEQLGQAFAADPERKDAFHAGVALAYRTIVNDKGGAPGVFDKKSLREAAGLVLGGRVHQWKGITVELPPWADGNDWDNWFKKIPHDHFSTHYKFHKYNASAILRDLNEGDLRPVHVGQGEYFLFNMKDTPPRAIHRKPSLGETGPQIFLFKPLREHTLEMGGRTPLAPAHDMKTRRGLSAGNLPPLGSNKGYGNVKPQF